MGVIRRKIRMIRGQGFLDARFKARIHGIMVFREKYHGLWPP